jgi:hypothetical protein
MDKTTDNRKVVGECPICGRPLVDGPSVDLHHLIPKTYKGKETVLIHRVCHTKIHSLFTERELYFHYNTVERLRDHPEMEKFIKWLKNKDPEFRTGNEFAKSKGRR